MKQYLDLLDDVLTNGVARSDRTGTGTIGVFGRQVRFDLADGFPLLTTKKLFTKAIVGELIWFLNGDTNVRWLQENGITIWDEWSDPVTGDLGPVYGGEWRRYGAANPRIRTLDEDGNAVAVDQIANVLRGLRDDPFGRRHIVSAWNPIDVPDQALPACHSLFQFHVTPDEHGRPWKLGCHLYQRSADLFLGIPFNIASYALLTELFAANLGLVPGEFVHTLTDLHLYTNHLEQARLQLSRQPRPLPRVAVAHENAAARGWLIDGLLPNYQIEDVTVVDYDPWPAIKAPVSV